MNVVALRRLAVVSWVTSGVLIVLAAVLLLGFGAERPDAAEVDIDVQRAVPQRTVGLGAVGAVALLGAVAFAGGAALRLRADEAERREVRTSWGKRPARPPRGTIVPPSRGSHDDLLRPPSAAEDVPRAAPPESPETPETPENPDDTEREQP